MAVFRELWGVNVKCLFSNPEKAHPWAELRSLTYYAWKSVQGSGCWPLEEPGKKKPSKHFYAQFLAYGKKKPFEGSWINFSRRYSVDIQDVITCATFCDDRLRGLGVARGRISCFPIDLRRRTYNTLALPSSAWWERLYCTAQLVLEVVSNVVSYACVL